jgi:hypothetical protein
LNIKTDGKTPTSVILCSYWIINQWVPPLKKALRTIIVAYLTEKEIKNGNVNVRNIEFLQNNELC